MDRSAAFELFGVRLLGVNAESGRKLALTIGFVIAAWLIGVALRRLLGLVGRASDSVCHSRIVLPAYAGSRATSRSPTSVLAE